MQDNVSSKGTPQLQKKSVLMDNFKINTIK